MIKHKRAMSSTNGQSDQARRFLALRLALKMSQQAFAESLGISLRAEQNYERGARRLPAEVLLNVAKVHQIDPLWLLDGPGDVPRSLAVEGLNAERLAKAMRLVQAAVSGAGKAVSEEQVAHWISAVYRFYSENASGAGAESLVNTLIGAK